jgi:hypothetical protein
MIMDIHWHKLTIEAINQLREQYRKISFVEILLCRKPRLIIMGTIRNYGDWYIDGLYYSDIELMKKYTHFAVLNDAE